MYNWVSKVWLKIPYGRIDFSHRQFEKINKPMNIFLTVDRVPSKVLKTLCKLPI